MTTGDAQRLRIGVLGAGPIAQFAHFESCAKARNAELHAICDVADDLLDRMSAAWRPAKKFNDYDRMLADPDVDAIIIATSDAFHVPASIAALNAGKHVLCEKPIATTLEDVLALKRANAQSQRVLQIGHMKRFDPGIQAAKRFIELEIGELQAIKAWYCDSTHRYTVTNAIQPLPILSKLARRPARNPNEDKQKYYILAHGSHLVDLARHFGGEIASLSARLSTKFESYCWFVDVEYQNGCLGHLDLTVAVRMDWHEGFQIYGERGAIVGRTFNPWYFKSSEVDIFRESTGEYSRLLGADGHFYRRQVESFADAALNGSQMMGASIEDGEASVRAMIAIRRSVETGQPVRLDSVEGSV